MHRWLGILLLLPLLALVSGCMTNKLWTGSALDNWNQPAAHANLRLFATLPPQDFLVVYDENSDRHKSTTTRAFLLNENLERLAQKRAPHFVNAALARGLMPVPVLPASSPSSTNGLTKPFALYSTNSPAFVLYYADGESVFYHLPIYNDGTGKYKRAALTPLTVTEDAGIVVGVASLIWLEAATQSGCCFGYSPH